MSQSKIEWTDQTWNPVTGCTKISEGCTNCYAAVMARRLKGMHKQKYQNGFNLTLHPESLNEPKGWKKPCNIFVCSMGDLFHKDVPFDFIDKVIQTISDTPQHRYQILTKRAERMAEYFKNRIVPNNVWIGVTVECSRTKERIKYLQGIPAEIHFLSCEPLLEALGPLDLDGIEWVIVGGESGMQARPMKKDWVMEIKHQADVKGIAFFFKQWGTWGADSIKRSKGANGKLLDGEIVQNMPNDTRHQ